MSSEPAVGATAGVLSRQCLTKLPLLRRGIVIGEKGCLYYQRFNRTRESATVDDTLKQLLAAESAASELVDNAQKEADHLIQTALQEGRHQEERFDARVPELHASFLEKSDQRAQQTVGEMERRFQERISQLRVDADRHERAALDAAFRELLGTDKQ